MASDAEMTQLLQHDQQKKTLESAQAMAMVLNSIRRYGPPRHLAVVPLDDNGNAAEFYTHDEYGLALDPRLWCKRACNNCNGTGRIIKIVQENGKPTRQMHPCPRANSRYNLTREAVAGRVFRAGKRGGEEGECRELERIHLENGHRIKVTKSPITPSETTNTADNVTPAQLRTTTPA